MMRKADFLFVPTFPYPTSPVCVQFEGSGTFKFQLFRPREPRASTSPHQARSMPGSPACLIHHCYLIDSSGYWPGCAVVFERAASGVPGVGQRARAAVGYPPGVTVRGRPRRVLYLVSCAAGHTLCRCDGVACDLYAWQRTAGRRG